MKTGHRGLTSSIEARSWRRLMGRSLICLLAGSLLLAISACNETITRDNYKRIEQGMTRDEVVAILGEPDESRAVSLGAINGETAFWHGRTHRISVSFAQGEVVLSTMTDAPPDSS